MQEYLERIHYPEMENYRRKFKNSIRWNGIDDLDKKVIVVYCEGGYGDVVQFCRYFKELKTKGCEVILYCSRPLMRILSKVEGVDGLWDNLDKVPKHDYHVLSMSLPFLLEEQPVEFPYVKIDNKIEVPKDKLKIGIAWEGNPDHTNNDLRSCPLKFLKPLWEIKNSQIFMVQKEVKLQTLTEDCQSLELYSSKINDFYDLAVLINEMDVIVTVDTSVVHIAGALNKPTYLMLSNPEDPRWEVKEWYPNVTIIRQVRSWGPVVKEIVSRIKKGLK